MIKFLLGDAPGREIAKQVIALSGSAFGLIAALAWNEAIQTLVNQYLSFSVGSQIISKVVYALLVTFLLVVATVQLARLKHRFAPEEEVMIEKKEL